jgi:hypothetical protein
LTILKKAADELTTFVGKEKGAGEVISFCLARTSSIAGIFKRAEKKLLQTQSGDEVIVDIDLDNISLLVVGRSKHPLLQFLGDIISGGFDADKLDYLLRDASAAGLPLRYDLERYLYTVFLDKNILADDEGELAKLYDAVGSKPERRKARPPEVAYDHFDTNRLRLPKQAMSTIEQIVICKLMLFSYIYHHQKVRAAEGMLVKLLERAVADWRQNGRTEEQILEIFLSATDAILEGEFFRRSTNRQIANYSYRVLNRLLPREVYRISPAFSHAEGALIKNFFTTLEDKARRKGVIAKLEKEIGEQLCKKNPALGKSAEEALWNAGVWVDVPKVPKFEDMSVLVGRTPNMPGVPISDVFPIGQWTQAYESHRFYIRIFAFSEAFSDTAAAARAALEKVTEIKSNDFYRSCLRTRDR